MSLNRGQIGKRGFVQHLLELSRGRLTFETWKFGYKGTKQHKKSSHKQVGIDLQCPPSKFCVQCRRMSTIDNFCLGSASLRAFAVDKLQAFLTSRTINTFDLKFSTVHHVSFGPIPNRFRFPAPSFAWLKPPRNPQAVWTLFSLGQAADVYDFWNSDQFAGCKCYLSSWEISNDWQV